MNHLEEGSLAPDFELQTPEGTLLKLSEAIRFGPIAVVFYKSECATSQFTFPFIQKIFSGITASSKPGIWGISQDDADETRHFIAEHGLEFPVALDLHPFAVSSSYELRFVPTFYVIDRERRVRMADFGFSKHALNTIAKELAESAGCRPPAVFSDVDGLPDRRPG